MLCIMCMPFGVYFHGIWHIDGWVSISAPMRPVCKIECWPVLENFARRAPLHSVLGEKLGDTRTLVLQVCKEISIDNTAGFDHKMAVFIMTLWVCLLCH